ncbi:hypothetical protein ALC53_07892 [Atta colombica]|uniref:Uncharacterized protein n=1 Tax=Atta colombica TaxID=520822 RepID=A0A195BAD6_9HYME|nr:hypothetical protein ALC53_07892 [Atta colombica]
MAILSDSDLNEYKTKSTCNANHRFVQGLLACVFSNRYPDNTDGAFADTCSKLGTGPDGDDGDLKTEEEHVRSKEEDTGKERDTEIALKYHHYLLPRDRS